MYQIHCDQCDNVGFHPSRVGAECRADTHRDETGHDCEIGEMAVENRPEK